MSLPRPTVNFTDWVESTAANRVEPGPSRKNSGYSAEEPLPARHFNWLLYSIDQWVKYLDSNTSGTVIRVGTSAQVASGRADFDSLQDAYDAIQDSTYPEGSRIQILEGTVVLPTPFVADGSIPVMIFGSGVDSKISGDFNLNSNSNIVRDILIDGVLEIDGKSNILDVHLHDLGSFYNESGDNSNKYRILRRNSHAIMSDGNQDNFFAYPGTSVTLNETHNGMTIYCETEKDSLPVVINLPINPRKGFKISVKDHSGNASKGSGIIVHSGINPIETHGFNLHINQDYDFKTFSTDGASWSIEQQISPITKDGDLIVGDFNGNPSTFEAGSNDSILQSKASLKIGDEIITDLALTGGLLDVVSGGNVFLAKGTNGNIYRSITNGASWVEVYNGPLVIENIVFVDGMFVLTTVDDILVSKDYGETFDLILVGSTTAGIVWKNILRFRNGSLLMVGFEPSSEVIISLLSKDKGETWESQQIVATDSVYRSSVYNDSEDRVDVFYKDNNSSFSYLYRSESVDGVAWGSVTETSVEDVVDHMVFGQGCYYCVCAVWGVNTRVLRSFDGNVFRSLNKPSDISEQFKNVSYENSVFMITTSSDSSCYITSDFSKYQKLELSEEQGTKASFNGHSIVVAQEFSDNNLTAFHLEQSRRLVWKNRKDLESFSLRNKLILNSAAPVIDGETDFCEITRTGSMQIRIPYQAWVSSDGEEKVFRMSYPSGGVATPTRTLYVHQKDGTTRYYAIGGLLWPAYPGTVVEVEVKISRNGELLMNLIGQKGAFFEVSAIGNFSIALLPRDAVLRYSTTSSGTKTLEVDVGQKFTIVNTSGSNTTFEFNIRGVGTTGTATVNNNQARTFEVTANSVLALAGVAATVLTV